MDKCNHTAQNIVHMAEYKPETGYTALAQVEAYWEALRGIDQLPKRSQIDPRGIGQALEHTFILERIAPGLARLRIAGSHLNDLMGMEVRGMPLTALFAEPSRRGLSEVLEEVFQMPAAASLRLSSDADPNRPALSGRLILLPLMSDLGDVSRLLGCIVIQGRIGRAPRHFNIASKTLRSLASPMHGAELGPGEPASGSHMTPIAGFAEPGRPFQRKTKGPRPSYLRIVRPDEME